MITEENNRTTITCDKCGRSETVPTEGSGKLLYANGWSLNSHARKYVHKCVACLTKKQRRTMTFVQTLLDR